MLLQVSGWGEAGGWGGGGRGGTQTTTSLFVSVLTVDWSRGAVGDGQAGDGGGGGGGSRGGLDARPGRGGAGGGCFPVVGGGGREAGGGRSPFEGSGVPLPWPETASSGPHGPAALAGPSGKGCVLPPVPPPHTSFHETGSETRQGLGL